MAVRVKRTISLKNNSSKSRTLPAGNPTCVQNRKSVCLPVGLETPSVKKLEAADILNVLRKKIAILSGGCDKHGSIIIVFPAQSESSNLNFEDIVATLTYISSVASYAEKQKPSFTIVVDVQNGAFLKLKTVLRAVQHALGQLVKVSFVVVQDAFWDRHRLANDLKKDKCSMDFRVRCVSAEKLMKYIDQTWLLAELGGKLNYNHEHWLQTRLGLEKFLNEANTALRHLDTTYLKMYSYSHPTGHEDFTHLLRDHNNAYSVAMNVADRVIIEGQRLLGQLQMDGDSGFKTVSEKGCQTALVSRSQNQVRRLLKTIQEQKLQLQESWIGVNKDLKEFADLSKLEACMSDVVDWVLNKGEKLLTTHQGIGNTYMLSESLRRKHEQLELRCIETYGIYAELRHKVDLIMKRRPPYWLSGIREKKERMDAVCLNFASRLERRRNLLIISVRFHRTALEVHRQMDSLMEFLMAECTNQNLRNIESMNGKLESCREEILLLVRDLNRDGDWLMDTMMQPVCDTSGADVTPDHSEDMASVRRVMKEVHGNWVKLEDALDSHKLQMWQSVQLSTCERDAQQSIEWIMDLCSVLVNNRISVGCSLEETKSLWDEHAKFEETARGTYVYGQQLLQTSLALRRLLGQYLEPSMNINQRLFHAWKTFLAGSTERGMRLRVCLTFYAKAEQVLERLHQLMVQLETEIASCHNQKSSILRNYMPVRDMILVDARFVAQTGKALLERLELPVIPDYRSTRAYSDEFALEHIGDKMAAVSQMADQVNAIMADDVSSLEDWRSLSSYNEAEDRKTAATTSSAEWKTAEDCQAEEWLSCDEEEYFGDEEMNSPIRDESEFKNGPWKLTSCIRELCETKVSNEWEQGPTSATVTHERVIEKWESTTESTHRATRLSSVVLKKPRGAQECDGEKEMGDLGPCEGSCTERPQPTALRTGNLSLEEQLLVTRFNQSKEHIQLKILEMEPDLTRVGTTLSEALELQKQHEDVLTKLQGKQSPVEELLNQADQLISSQNPRAEVYAAMAESLGLAWKDLNSQLEHRKQLLDQSVAFQTRASEYSERMDKAEKDFQDGALANDADSVRKLLQRHHDTKKGILEASMHTLNEGQSLLARLREIAAQGNGDSRPGNLKQSASTACYQVERVMEELHDRRRLLEETWAKKKSLLEQCLQLVLLYGDLEQVEELLKTKGKEFIQNTNVGDSPATSEIMQHEHGKVEQEAKQIQDKCVRLLRTAEQFVNNNHYAGGKAQTRAYKVLEDCAVFCSHVEARKKLLASAVAFFRLAQTALTKLDQLEVQLATNDTRSGSALSQQQTQILHTIEDVTSPAIQEGHNLLDSTNRNDSGVQGVVRTVAELEERRRKLESLCSSQRIETLEQTEAFKSFCANFNSIYYWVVNHCEAFLQGHQDMGSVLAMAKDFLHAHEQLQNDVQNKSFEVEALMRSMQNLLKNADPDADQVEQMSEDLRTHWIHMKTILEDRIRIARSYLNFHKLAVNLANELDALEDLIRGLIDGSHSESALKDSEEKWLGIQQMHLQMKNTGKNFIFDAKKSKDPHLDIQRAILCVDTLLEHFQARQKELAHLLENWQSHMSQEKAMKSQWHKVSVEVQTTIEWVLKFEAELYPILIVDTVNIQNIIFNLERKMESSQQLSKKSEADLEEQLKIVEAAARSSDSESDMQRVATELREVLRNFQRKFTEYQILLNMLVSYFKRLYELEKMVENLEVQYTTTLLPLELSEVELLLREHEASRQAVHELFKFTHVEREQLISRIRQQEPAAAAAHDEDRVTKLVHLTHQHWEKSWQEHKTHIEQHLQLCHFNHDLKQINNHLNELTSQLSSIRGNYGESVNSAKATSQAFIQFEKTIELLERKIRVFVSSAEKMLTDRHFESSRIQQELDEIQNKWSSFHMQVGDNRKKITQSIEYFTLVEEIEEWFMEGSKLLITIARKSSQCRTPAEANDLLKEVDNYLKSSEAKQAERLRKVTQMSIQLSGGVPDKANLVAEKNREMMDSFAVINKELTTLTSNLITLDEQRQQQIKEKEEVDAALVAAKAEAVAARASATAAEEARRAAETAARAMPIVLEKTEIRTFETVQKRTPSPKPPAVPPKPVAPEFTIPLKSSEVVEGVKFKFECRVKGVPTPEVSWYKDTMHILNNPDYPTTFENGVCTLIIEETFSEDTATFTCKATNPAGSAETSGQLTVKESRPVEEFTAPEFVKELQSGTVKVADVHELECRVTGHPLPVVSWFKNDICVDNCPDYVITFNNGTCILRFEELFLQDGARYTCNAVNQAGQASSVATLTVEPRESTEAPEFVQALSNVMARAGQKLRLECCVKGVPQPEITWLHNNKPIQENRDVKVQFDGGKATLVVTEAFPKDAGTYLAIAKNRAGEATSSCTVAVKGRLPLETSDSELPSDLEPVKPRILQQLKDMTVSEGFKTRMDCIIVGQPEPEVIWYHDGKPVKESNDFQLLFEGDKCSLVIREAFAEDAGEYKVVAINSAGEASSSCRLCVDSPSEHGNLEHSERNVTLVIENTVTPNFEKLLSDVTCTEGENLVLECVASGVPPPTFSWYRENQRLSPSEDVSINTNASGRSLLQLRNSKTDHSGMYSAKASNKCGDAKSFCHVTVCRPPREVITKVFAKSDVGSSPPQFTQLFTDETVAIGEPVRFVCNISGNPYPKVQWYFKGEPITPRDFQITADGEKHSLAISSAKPEHKGRFTCTAENDRGKSTCAAVLDITEPMALSVNHHKDEFHDHRVGHYGGTKTTSIMESKFTSKTTEVRSGSGAEFHHLSAREEHAIKKVGDQPAEEMHSSERDEYHKSTDDGFTVKQIPKLMDKVGDVQHTIVGSKLQFPILESTGKLTLPPKFSQPVMSVVVHEGEPAKLEGHVHGYPEPSVKWYKNSVEIVRSDWRMVYENGVATISIPKSCVKDSGRYTCTARNALGTASSTADLLIKPIQEAPQFVQCLRAQVVKSGDSVEMEVEVSGMPEPKVSWYKNGMPIEKSDGYRVKRDGNKHTLIIQKADPDDTGKFMVKAENPAGEAQCIADFLVEDPALVNVEKIAYERVSVIEEKKQTMSKFSTSTTPTVTRIEFPPSPSPRPQRTPTPPKDLAPALPEYTAPASKFWKPRKVPRAEKAILEPTFSADESFPLPSDVEFSEPELALAAPKLVKVKMAPPPPPPKPIAKPEATKAPHIGSVKSPIQKSLQSPVDDIHRTQSPKPVSKQDGFFPVHPTPSTSAATTPSVILERVPPPVSPKPASSVKFTKTETTVTTTSSMTNEQISSPTWKPTQEPISAWKPVKAPNPVLNVHEDSSKKVYVVESSFELPPLKNLATQQCIQIGIDSVLRPGPPPEFGFIRPDSVTRQSSKVVPPTPPTPTTMPRGGVPVYPGLCDLPKQRWSDDTAIVRHKSFLAPVFVKLLADKDVWEGEEVLFECIVHGDPEPCIEWQKDGKVLQDSTDFQISYSRGACRLTVPEVYHQDGGTFTCMATNSAGSASTSAVLNLKAMDGNIPPGQSSW